MPQASILRRDLLRTFVEGRPGPDQVQVIYTSDVVGFGVVSLPLDLYRPAIPAELAQAPALLFVPLDMKAQDAERKAIAADLQRRRARPGTVVELP